MNPASRNSNRMHHRLPALGLALMLLAGSILHTAPAHANGYYWGNAGAFWGAFAGGLLLGAAFAPRYYYGPGWYPPPVVAAPPPVYYGPPAYYGPPVAATVPAPPVVQRSYSAPPPPPAIPRLSVEERLQRLKRLCDQALLTKDECRHRRELIARDL